MRGCININEKIGRCHLHASCRRELKYRSYNGSNISLTSGVVVQSYYFLVEDTQKPTLAEIYRVHWGCKGSVDTTRSPKMDSKHGKVSGCVCISLPYLRSPRGVKAACRTRYRERRSTAHLRHTQFDSKKCTNRLADSFNRLKYHLRGRRLLVLSCYGCSIDVEILGRCNY